MPIYGNCEIEHMFKFFPDAVKTPKLCYNRKIENRRKVRACFV